MYKKCTTNIGMPHGYVKKFLLTMKITSLVMFLALMQANAAVFSQKITYEKKGATLKEVFAEINRQTGYNIFWSPKKVKDAPKLDVSFHETPLEEVLRTCLHNLPLTFAIEGSNVIIKESAATRGTAMVEADMTVKGTVRDENGEGVPGVSVLLKGTTNGTTTDRDGNYQIVIPEGSDGILVFSFLGYKTKEELASGRSVIDVSLEVDVASLEEVVVVAFGTQKKSSMVSAIETVNPAELKVPSSNLTTALAGRVSGVIAYQRSGEPGADNSDFFIRGVTTFGYKKDPLILIDGIEQTSRELARLHVDDIAAFSILKDATATALYGARGANGVIQVTTKRGNEGPATIAFRVENSFSSNTQNIALADPVTYMQLANEAVTTRNPLAPSLYSPEKIDGTRAGTNPYLYPATDWRKMLIKKTVSNQRYNLNVSGGTSHARYYVSGVLYQDNGNLNVDKRSNFNNNINLKTYQLRSNITINLTKTTELISRLSGIFDDYNGPVDTGADIYKKIIRSNPVMFPAFYPASFQPGTNHILFGNATRGGGALGANYTNPYADLVKGYKDYSKSSMDAQFELKQDLNFVLPGLAVSGIFNTSRYAYFDVNRFYNPYYYNISTYNPETDAYTLSLLNASGSPTEYLNYNEGKKDINSTTYIQGNIIYNKKINEAHDVSGLVVFQRRQQLFANQGTLQKSLPYRNQGISGRFTYGYRNRYLAEFTFGYNGSERFYKKKQYGFFPAVGAGWVVSNEKFFEPLQNVIQVLKLKGTYGLVGNDAIGDENDRFFYLSNVNLNDDAHRYTFGENLGTTRNGVSISRYDNRDISWETARKLNLGIELGILNEFDLLVDYFTEYRYNILMTRSSIPASAGLAVQPRANVGEARGRGVDMSLDYSRSFAGGAWLKVRANYTYAHSEYVKYEEPQYAEAYRYHGGQPINQIYGLVAERLFVDENEVNNSPKQTYGEYHAGDIKYRDMNGDGQITDADQVPIGHPWLPEIVYGFGFSLGYKGVDLSAFCQGSARSSFWLDASNTSPFQNDVPLLQAYADSHWSEENRNLYAVWPRLSTTYNANNSARYSTWFMRNGAFLRVKTIELGYTLTPQQLKRLGMESARVYVSGNNLFLLSGFNMWDIEMGGDGLGYPIQKVYNLGLQVKF